MSLKMFKLLPEQIMDYWSQIGECIAAALPVHIVENDVVMIHIQEKLLLGMLECWLVLDGVNLPIAVLTTQFVIDDTSKCKNLLVYTLAILADHDGDVWQLALGKLMRYAHANACSNIVAYSFNPAIIHIAEKLGADTSSRLIVFKVQKLN